MFKGLFAICVPKKKKLYTAEEEKYTRRKKYNNASHVRWKQQLTCLRVIIANDKNVDVAKEKHFFLCCDLYACMSYRSVMGWNEMSDMMMSTSEGKVFQ